MNFGPRRRPEASIELTPLIDVVFLLLIFFMVSTSFVREARIAVDLPEAAGDAPAGEAGLALSIDAAGGYAVNGHALADGEVATLVGALRPLAEPDGQSRLLIAADASATHRAVVRAMDAARRAGIARIDIATREPER
ncbi:MAG: biopolymer transporter ExbD [Gammaproteobacteria bacterium]|nr:biopolymer transporter ExbD [Gammaproteobacteria bacterium]